MLAEANDAWREWLKDHPKHRPSTVARWRSTLAAALAEGAREYKTTAPRLERRKSEEPDRVVYLTNDERRRLLAAYNQWAACLVLLLAYQGLRTQEALRLDWRRIDFNRKTLHIIGEETKSRRGRTVPMHDRVEKLLHGMWCSADGRS